MAQPAPLSDAEKQSIRDLHAEGLSRNVIARRVGRSTGAVSAFCQREGLTFPSLERVAQVEAAALSMKERGIAAHEREMLILEFFQEQLIAGFRSKRWRTLLKGAGGSEHEAELGFVPPADWRNAQNAITSASLALKNLAPVDDAGRTAAVSVIESLARSLGLPPEVPGDGDD